MVVDISHLTVTSCSRLELQHLLSKLICYGCVFFVLKNYRWIWIPSIPSIPSHTVIVRLNVDTMWVCGYVLVEILTLSTAFKSAPLSISSRTTSMCPSVAACITTVQPSYECRVMECKIHTVKVMSSLGAVRNAVCAIFMWCAMSSGLFTRGASKVKPHALSKTYSGKKRALCWMRRKGS